MRPRESKVWECDYGRGNAPVDDACPNAEPSVRRSSVVPSFTKWSQSKPSTKSQGREAVTGTLDKSIETMPASHGSVRGPEGWEACVGRPELITQSRETQDLAVRPSNPVNIGVSQKVARDDMGEKAKMRVCWQNQDVAGYINTISVFESHGNGYWLEHGQSGNE
ncbi:hypothetical protein B0H17DRAFT_1148935 [Mycena rosella]|uniref:Uncharacterized protein n=1 Tax=Mycena rosella TaxID=1033263 RepID=A0AAD7C6Q7_MYCRO|nr:hypothetical protein B0H17DRAFT_1148935 [Mycena rosella]